MPFVKDERKKSAVCFSKTGKLSKFANRQISQQKLSIDFKKPFDFLANLRAEARGETSSEAKGEEKANRLMWCLLDEIRTHFEQNPEDFAD